MKNALTGKIDKTPRRLLAILLRVALCLGQLATPVYALGEQLPTEGGTTAGVEETPDPTPTAPAETETPTLTPPAAAKSFMCNTPAAAT